jgi:hypothetical protein
LSERKPIVRTAAAPEREGTVPSIAAAEGDTEQTSASKRGTQSRNTSLTKQVPPFARHMNQKEGIFESALSFAGRDLRLFPEEDAWSSTFTDLRRTETKQVRVRRTHPPRAQTPLHDKVEDAAPKTTLAIASPTKNDWESTAIAPPLLLAEKVSLTTTAKFVHIWL